MTGAPSAHFDEAGNQIRIGGHTLGYDAENRQKESTVSGVTTSYAYDGQGRRVKKVLGPNTTVFVYDAFGQLAAEYGPEESGEPRTSYLTADHLGSTRVVTDANGEVTERHDYRPFGEELFASVSGRTSDLNYPGGDTGVRLKFTGKERDAETGLDYFLARYYSAAQGRFTSPDEWAGGIVDPFTGQQVGQPGPLPYADITDPQTLNKYAYVRNNPLRYTDPDGHILDTLLDVASIAYDVYKIINEGATRENVTALGADSLAAVIPGITGAGAVVRTAGKVDDVVDAARAVDRVADTSKTAKTVREAQREAMRAEGIPTSLQPTAQKSTPAGRQYTYEVPKPGGGTEQKIVTRQHKDRSHPGQTHVEAGRPKPAGQTDPSGRRRHRNDKTKVNVDETDR
jgi:RHS repeat-associated protein